MAKFLRAGPCRLVPYGKSKLGFFLLILNIASTLVGKTFMLMFVDEDYDDSDFIELLVKWPLMSMVPQMLFVSYLLCPSK